MPRVRGRAPISKEEKQKAVVSLKRLFVFLFRTYPLHLVGMVVCIVISVLANVQGTLFIQTLIDQYIMPMLKEDSTNFTPLLSAIGRVAIFYAIGILAAFFYNLIMAFVAQGTLKRLRDELFVHMQDLPIKYFDTHAYGDIMSIYTNDIDTLRQMIGQSLPQIINSAITIVAVFISMLSLSIPLTIITLLMVGLMLIVTARLAKLSSKFFVKQQQDLGAVNGFTEEMIKGQKVIKVFCHEKKAVDAFEKINETLCDSATRANRYANIMMPANAQIGNISYVLIAVFGGMMAISGFAGLTLGKLASFLTFNRSFNMPINQVSQQMNFIIMAMAGAGRIFALLDEGIETDEGYATLVNVKEEKGQLTETNERTGTWAWKHPHKESGEITYQKLAGDVVFSGVDFSYNDKEVVLHDINLYATPGQKIAFVGATGAGKTTMTNLINRFYDIKDGKIRYDGIDIYKIKKPDLRRSLGMVLQDTHLFTGTIEENIRYGKLDASREEVIEAAKLANADGFIRKLSDGYDTVIAGDGGALSQGQRQLLAIARAAIADPPVLILDEATSSIDTRTERIVQEGMDRLMKGRTTFVIAHRLSTIKNSDCIMVMDNGRIIERGSHEELLAEKGRYYELYTGKKGSS